MSLIFFLCVMVLVLGKFTWGWWLILGVLCCLRLPLLKRTTG